MALVNTIKYRTDDGFKLLKRITKPLTFHKNVQVMANYIDLHTAPLYLFVELEGVYYRQTVKLETSLDVNSGNIRILGGIKYVNHITGYGIVSADNHAVKLPIGSKIELGLVVRTK